jgi:putative solute:sodium symporter small subunit
MAQSPSTPRRPRTGQRTHWQRVRRLTAVLLAVWFGVTFGVIFFARELSAFTLLGWPVSFYMAAQGTILIYLAIVAIYAWRMRRLDQALEQDSHAE